MDWGTLLSVLLGAAIASGTTFWLERKRTDREDAAAKEQRREDSRRATRLLGEELGAARRLLAAAVERGYYTWDPPRRLLPSASWTEYRAEFSRLVKDEDWFAVLEAYFELDRLNWHLTLTLEENRHTGVTERRGPIGVVPLDERADVPGALRAVDRAIFALASAASRDRRGEPLERV